jgi:hypothetical protein
MIRKIQIGPHACWVSAISLEPHPQPFLLQFVFQIRFLTFAWTSLCLSSSWDYKIEPSCLACSKTFLINVFRLKNKHRK